MDDQTPPPLAVYQPAKKKRPRRGPSPGVQKGIFLIAGIAIGGAIAIATLRFARRPERIVYRTPQSNAVAPAKTGSVERLDSAPVQSAAPGPKPEAGDPKAQAGQQGKAGAQGAKGAAVQPFNPFDGSLAAAMPPREITGHITAGPSVTMPKADATHGGVSQDPAPRESEPIEGLLVTIRLNVGDPNQALQALEGVATKEGGSLIEYDETAASQDPEGAILFVPAAKADEAQKSLAAVGSVVVSDTWTGPSTARLDRIEGPAKDRISDLHIKRQELLVKFLEDAPQIKHIDEDSDRINKSLAALRSHRPGLKTAVLKIKFLD